MEVVLIIIDMLLGKDLEDRKGSLETTSQCSDIETSKYGKKGISLTQHIANKSAQQKEQDMSSVKTFIAGLEFIEEHRQNDNWF